MPDTSFLDWPFFTPSHRELVRGAGSWARRELELHADDADVDATCRDLVDQLGRAGWLRYCVPAEHGGIHERVDVRSLCLLRETLAWHGGLVDFAFAMQGLGAGPIALFGTSDQKKRYLPPVAEGRSIAAFALSEPDSGSDVAALATTARRDGDGYVLEGTKTWISNAGIADHYVVFARTDEAAGARGISAFVVDADTPGLEVTRRIDVTAPHPLGTLSLSDCRVSGADLVGPPGRGFAVAMATLDTFRSTVGAAALGFARRAMDEALAQTGNRRAFGGVLADLPAVRLQLGDMALAIDAAALLIYRAAWTRDTQEGRVTREAAMAKLFATEHAQRVIDQALQLHGAAGVVANSVLERLYREIRPLRIYEGASDVLRQIIARQTVERAEHDPEESP